MIKYQCSKNLKKNSILIIYSKHLTQQTYPIMNTETYKLRQTAKFNTIQNINTTTVSSRIILPIGKTNAKQRHIKWFRYYAKTIQRLLYMDDLMLYECSPLDLDCKIEGVVENLYQQRQSCSSANKQLQISKIERTVSEKFEYGPCKMDNKILIKPAQYTYTQIAITLIFDGNRPDKQAKIFIDNGIIIQANQKYGLTVEDVCSMYIGNIKKYQIAIGSMSQGKALNKLFKQSSYNQMNYLPTKIVFHDSEAFNTTLFLINRLKFSFGSKTSLKSLANYKNQMSISFTSDDKAYKKNSVNKHNFQKQSNLTAGLGSTSPTHSLNQRITTTASTINSPNRLFSPNNHLKGSDLVIKKSLKKSKLASQNSFPTTNHEQQQLCNFMVQFDDLFQDQKQEQQLCLNNSFEQFQKKSKASEDLERIKEIQKKKEQKKLSKQQCQQLGERIKQLQKENQQFQKVNKNLLKQIQVIKEIRDDSSTNETVLENKLKSMRQYYQQLLRQSQTQTKQQIY